MLPSIKKYKNKQIEVCPTACKTAKCIHDLHITNCHSCVNRLSLKSPHLIQKTLSKTHCKTLCASYNCSNLEICKSQSEKKGKISDGCPYECRLADCLKQAKNDPNDEIPPELIPCVCHSAELWQFAGGPVSTSGYNSSFVYRHKQVLNIFNSFYRAPGSSNFEVILREPACEKNVGWHKRYIKSTQIDGSIYKGTINELGFAGDGQLRLPNGVTYDGEFDQGRFHGKGTLTYPSGVSVEGIWDKGKNIVINWIRFADGLKYKKSDWEYLSPPDRRFYPEHTEGLQPESHLYRTGNTPTPHLPVGTYDSGDGYYSPKEKCIYDYETNETIRIPCRKEVEWIEKNCRYGWRETIGNNFIA